METFRTLRKLPRELWILSVVTLIHRMGTMALPFLALYVTERLGFSIRDAGFIVGVYGIGALVVSPVGGWLADRFGGVRILLFSLLSSAVVMLFYPLVTGFWGLVVITLVWSLTAEVGRASNLTLISEWTKPAQRKPAFALQRLAINLGMSFGPALGGFLAQVSLSTLFIVNALATFAAGLLLWFFLGRKASVAEPEAHPSHKISGLHAFRVALQDRRLRWFLIACIANGIVFFQHQSILPIFLVDNLNLPKYFFGLIFSLNTLVIVALEIPLNVHTAHWSYRRNFILGALLFAIGFGALAIASGAWSVIVMTLIWTFGEMILFPALSAYVSEIAPSRKQGAYMGLFTSTFSISFILAPLIGAWLLESFGPVYLWSAIGLVGIFSSLLFLKTPKRIHPDVDAIAAEIASPADL